MTSPIHLACSAPPCPNGKLHLGHIGGVYLPADVFIRFRRARGEEAFHLTGADEHGSYTLRAALQQGRQVEEVAAENIDAILTGLQAMDIHPDMFVRTSDRDHAERSMAIYSALVARGRIRPEVCAQLYCPSCNDFAADSFVTGFCPECASPCDGSVCEGCGSPVQQGELRRPHHAAPCGHSLELRPLSVACLDIGGLADALVAAIAGSSWASPVKREALEWIDHHRAPLAMSRAFSRGVRLRHPAAVAGQTLLTWFEGLWCFETGACRLLGSKGLDFDALLHSGAARLSFFMGEDNRVFYTAGVSASLIARGHPLPHAHSVHAFWKLDGAKFSTSRAHALWADESASQIGPDLLRFYLMRESRPWSEEAPDFSVEGFSRAGRALAEIDDRIRRARPRAGPMTAADSALFDDYIESLENLRFHDAVEVVERYGRQLDEHCSAASLHRLLSMLQPLTPGLAGRHGVRHFGVNWGPHLAADAPAVVVEPRDEPSLDCPATDVDGASERLTAMLERVRTRQGVGALA